MGLLKKTTTKGSMRFGYFRIIKTTICFDYNISLPFRTDVYRTCIDYCNYANYIL